MSIQNKYQLVSRFSQYNLTKQEWLDKNPILLKGEIGVESDTSAIKIGDGINIWSNLPYQYGLDLSYTAGNGISITGKQISTQLLYEIVEL